jgi:hypothetical protein
MGLPAAAELEAIFEAARRHGVTHLRVGGLEVRLAQQPEPVTGAGMVAAVNRAAPLPVDPLDIIRRQNGDISRRVVPDPLELLGSGARLLEQDPPDPTQAS